MSEPVTIVLSDTFTTGHRDKTMGNNPQDETPGDRRRQPPEPPYPGSHIPQESGHPAWGPPGQWGQRPGDGPRQAPWTGQTGWGAPPPGRFPGYHAPPKPGVIPLRPLGLGEILDGAFQACRRNPAATFGTAILFQVVIALLTMLLAAGAIGSLLQFDPESAAPADLVGFIATFASLGTIIAVLSGVGVLILQGALVIPVARAVLNQKTGFGLLWKLAGRRILPLVGLGLIIGLIVATGIAVFVVIAAGLIAAFGDTAAWLVIIGVLGVLGISIWLSIKVALAPAVLMLERAGPMTALRRSWMLTTGNWWRTFGILILTTIIVSIITSVITTPITLLTFQLGSFTSSPEAVEEQLLQSIPVLLITQLISAVFGAIGYAFQAAVTALLYVDLRIRREGFDVVLMRELEESGTGGSGGIPGRSGGQWGQQQAQQFGHRPASRDHPPGMGNQPR